MREMEERDPKFFFTYSKDAQSRLKNLLWSDAQSQMDYGAFGDIVVFVNTCRVNRYNLPFIPFIGVNHHRSTIALVAAHCQMKLSYHMYGCFRLYWR
jgi:zinc finger SWIM domain-containing protein 3